MEAGISTTTFIDTRFYLGTLAADRTVCPRPTTPLKLQLSHHARVLSCSLLFLSPFCVRENDVVCLLFIYLHALFVCQVRVVCSAGQPRERSIPWISHLYHRNGRHPPRVRGRRRVCCRR